jgi:hypothetical protein
MSMEGHDGLQLEYRNGGSWRYDCSRPKKTLISEGRLYAPKRGPKQRHIGIKNRYDAFLMK